MLLTGFEPDQEVFVEADLVHWYDFSIRYMHMYQ